MSRIKFLIAAVWTVAALALPASASAFHSEFTADDSGNAEHGATIHHCCVLLEHLMPGSWW